MTELLALLRAGSPPVQIRVFCVSKGKMTTVIFPRTYVLVYRVRDQNGKTRRYSELMFTSRENPLGKNYESTKERNMLDCYLRAQRRADDLTSAFPGADIAVAFTRQESEPVRE